MKYRSPVFCEHANECPTSVCQCPENCACRESMCSAESIIEQESQDLAELGKDLKATAMALKIVPGYPECRALWDTWFRWLDGFAYGQETEESEPKIKLGAAELLLRELDRRAGEIADLKAELERLRSLIAETIELSCGRRGWLDNQVTCISRAEPTKNWCRYCLSTLVRP